MAVPRPIRGRANLRRRVPFVTMSCGAARASLPSSETSARPFIVRSPPVLCGMHPPPGRVDRYSLELFYRFPMLIMEEVTTALTVAEVMNTKADHP